MHWNLTQIDFSTAEHEIETGDFLFLPGPPGEERPLFEHVAIARESRTVRTPSDIWSIRVYGLPEVDHASHGYSNLRLWRSRIFSGDLGDPTTGWVIHARHDTFERDLRERIMVNVANAIGHMASKGKPFQWDMEFRTIPEMDCLKTTCVGFACWCYSLIPEGRDIVQPCDPADAFDPPYSAPDALQMLARGEKTLGPTVGHLANAVGRDMQLPFKPAPPNLTEWLLVRSILQ
jgi:hypothetical protein